MEKDKVTDEQLYASRREWLKKAGLFVGTTAVVGAGLDFVSRRKVRGPSPDEKTVAAAEAAPSGLVIAKKGEFVVAGEDATKFKDATTYNNFYELGLGKEDPAENAATWSATSDAAWLIVTPASGDTPADPQLRVDPTGLAIGDYVGIVTLTSSTTGGDLPARTVRVTLTIAAAVDEATQRVYLPTVER